MKRIKPSVNPAYGAGLVTMLNDDERRRFRQAVVVAVNQAKRFDRIAPNFSRLRTRVSSDAGAIFVGAYKSKRAAVASFRERIRSEARFVGTSTAVTWCPYCGHDRASDLDHYLEKHKVPELALLSKNLVPCCPACNRRRGRTFDKNGQRQILYFYGDRIERLGCLLETTVHFDKKNVPSISFSTKVTRGELGRVFGRHFQALQLAKSFRTQASELLQNLKGQFCRRSIRVVQSIVRSDLKKADRTYGVNSCRSGVLRAILSSPDLMRWVRQ